MNKYTYVKATYSHFTAWSVTTVTAYKPKADHSYCDMEDVEQVLQNRITGRISDECNREVQFRRE